MQTPTIKTSRFIIAGVIVALLMAGGVALFASSSPDGLESVMLEGCTTTEEGDIDGDCVAQQAGEHEIGGPLADYGLSFVDNASVGGSLAGIFGVLLVLALATGLFWLLARGRRGRSEGA